MSMIAPTPPMGWNAWNTFSCDISDQLIREVADTIVREGFRDAGYTIVSLDDGWMSHERDSEGRLVPDPQKFPNGLKALGDYLHGLGLKFGIYSDAGTHTCAGYPASYGYERIDARSFAEWGVDLLKYDYCYSPAGAHDVTLYRRMGQALRETGRPIIYSVCWGDGKTWNWGRSVGAHMWRITGDIMDKWESVERVGYCSVGLESYAGPNAWNDPDMMVIGLNGSGYIGALGGGCTLDEYRTHFTLWCILCAPLLMGHDVRNTPPEIKEILLNKEAIAVNQDPAGIQAFRIPGWVEALAKPLEDGSVAVAVLNRESYRYMLPVPWEALGWEVSDHVKVRDLWKHEDLGIFKGAVTAALEPHSCAFYRLQRV